MSNIQQISALKEIFRKAKDAIRDDEDWLEDLKLHSALGEALIDVGKEKIYELVDEIYPYLNDPFSEFRAEAVRTLGWNTRLGINEFCCGQAYQIWLSDPEEEVKLAALAAWGKYYSETKNPGVIKKLYSILVSNFYSSEIRAWAFKSFLDVSNFLESPKESYSILELGDLINAEEFDRAIDWGRVNRIMAECVPGWKISEGR